MYIFKLILVLCFFTLSSASSSSHSKSIRILLQSKWTQTPIYLEVAEFLSDENQDFYWHYLDDLQSELAKSGTSLDQLTPHEQYELALRLASKLLRSEWKLSILKFSLALRSYSPKVVVFNNIAEDKSIECTGAFVELSVQTEQSDSTNEYVCGQPDQIKKSIEKAIELVNSDIKVQHGQVYSLDHIYPSGRCSLIQVSSSCITVILYAQIGSNQFYNVHSMIKSLVNSGKPIRYIIRHYQPPSQAGTTSRVALSGYGVELAIKSTEYKAQDDTRVRGEVVQSALANLTDDSEHSKPDEVSGFIFSKLKAHNTKLSEKLNEFRSYLLDQEKEIATLKVWQLQEISLQAVTKVLSVQKQSALSVLKDISQNFPSVARSLVKIHVEPELKKEISANQHLFYQNLNLGPSDTALFINGLYHDIESVDVFTLFDTAKQEFYVLSKLHSLMNGDQDSIKKLETNWDQQQNFEFQLDIRDAAIQYINDIEKDHMYRNWPSTLHEMLRPTYPGMLRNIRRNMYHLVLVIDPSDKQSFDMLRMAESFYIHKAPVRIGLVFDINDPLSVNGRQSASVASLQAFNYISQERSPYEALSFLTDVIAYATSQSVRNLEPDDIIYHFKSKFKLSDEDLEDVFGAESAYDTGRQLARDFLTRTGLQNGPKALLNGVLLKESHLNAEYFEDAVLTEIMRQSSQLQKAIYKNELTDQDDVLEWLMSKKTVMTRLNRIIFDMDQSDPKQTHSKKIVLDLSSGHVLADKSHDQSAIANGNINDLQMTLASTLKYINSKKQCNAVTLWLASDFKDERSRQILLAALNHLKEDSRSVRLALVYASNNAYTRVLESALSSINSSSLLLNTLIRLITQLDTEQQWSNASSLAQFIADEYRESFLSRLQELSVNDGQHLWPFSLHIAVSSRVLATMSSEHMSIVLNSKIYKLSLDSDTFNQDDFALMERFAQSYWTDSIMAVLTDAQKTSGTRKCSDLLLRICSVLLSKPVTSKQRHQLSAVNEDHSVLILEPRNTDQPFLELTAVLDPLTRGAQKLSPILETFYNVFNARVRVYFNAVEKHSEMPLKQFFRFVLDVEPSFDQTNGQLQSPLALFKSMPKTPLLTLGMAVPENWMVEPVSAIYDLDNIHLAQVSSSVVAAVFELEHLLVEGHCFEQSSGSPPRGLQFTLGTKSNPTKYDTIVMANLGYFQLKAAPGIWLLRLRSGRSADIYSIVSQDGTDQLANSTEVIPVVSSFRSLVIKIRVNKKPGKQHEELLYDSSHQNDNNNQQSGSWFSNWNSDTTDKGDSQANASGDEDSKRINVFSLASGHLYERLLRIMMLSVLKHTQTPVKFWFLKNYLSPQFKMVLPEMARRYQFQYELVQYKWPRWLHQQTEKQRIIWGYKILFLDVLFPLDVKKIIFVDADQVVRADLKELRDLDLEGAPYGYTPFCDSRKDMDGFRFWKSGYWATHLHGRKYHISALYVVDLQKFRRIAAGDRLRGQYQGLSQDPNSLSNLDQDLPNNMIHQVPIKSLPQEWLWCETWCDDESKKRAKTIDLCNNPKTKEPKLTSARRIVAEWQTYDDELKEFLELIQSGQHSKNKTQQSSTIIHQESKHSVHQEL